MNTQDWFPLGWTSWISWSPTDSQESSPTPQFKSISSLALCLLYGPAITTIHDHSRDHNLDYTDLCRQSHVSAFQHQVCHRFPAKKQSSSDFMAAVTICSDFRAQENRVCHCFHCFFRLHAMKWWDLMPLPSFSECWALSQLFHLLFHLHQEALLFFFTCCHTVV